MGKDLLQHLWRYCQHRVSNVDMLRLRFLPSFSACVPCSRSQCRILYLYSCFQTREALSLSSTPILLRFAHICWISGHGYSTGLSNLFRVGTASLHEEQRKSPLGAPPQVFPVPRGQRREVSHPHMRLRMLPSSAPGPLSAVFLPGVRLLLVLFLFLSYPGSPSLSLGPELLQHWPISPHSRPALPCSLVPRVYTPSSTS